MSEYQKYTRVGEGGVSVHVSWDKKQKVNFAWPNAACLRSSPRRGPYDHGCSGDARYAWGMYSLELYCFVVILDNTKYEVANRPTTLKSPALKIEQGWV